VKTKYTITKSYKVFHGEPAGEPMDEPNETQLFAWLRSHGLSEKEASALIERLDQDGQEEIEIEGI
jgi:hypothetical protein